MHGFGRKHLVEEAQAFTIWRRDHLAAVEVRGIVDDEVSDAWRAALGQEFERRCHPRFLVIDFSQCEPRNSMAARFRTVAFAREHMRSIEEAVLITGSKPGPLVVIRAALRIIGVPNLSMIVDPGELVRIIDRMSEGLPTSPPTSRPPE